MKASSDQDVEQAVPNTDTDGESKNGLSIRAKALAVVVVAGVVGVTVGLATSLPKKKEPDYISASINRLSYFDASVLDGYDSCQNLKLDLEEAVEILAITQINSFAKRRFHSDYSDWFLQRGGGMGGMIPTDRGFEVGVAEGDIMFDMPETMPSSPDADTGSSTGENSFGTNNQFDGVDEADLVKSNGQHVFAVYGSEVVVIDAEAPTDGNIQLLSRTQIPTDDENGIDFCASFNETDCYEKAYHYWWGQSSNIQIASLMIYEDVIAVIASSSATLRDSDPVLQNGGHTRIFVYDISSIPTDGVSPLTLLARKDLQGSYKTARSIDENAHIVTSSTLDIYGHLDSHTNPWNNKYLEMNESAYIEAALEVSSIQAALIAAELTTELVALFGDASSDDDCSSISKVAIMLKSFYASANIPSFTASSVLQTFSMVHSFDLKELSKGPDNVMTGVSSTGVFFPTPSYTSNVMASAEKLVITGESYVQDEKGDWNEQTVLLVYNLNNDTSVPKYVGEVPGSILNQFSMDHYFDSDENEDYLRVATTTWARWELVDDAWTQVSVSENQVSVLKMPLSGDDANDTMMEVVGRADGMGLDERIYAVRFLGEKAYMVTFRQTDPFYTLDMSDPTNPLIAGELKILGFSNYLHPVNEDLILAIGQNATEFGRAIGLQISLFDVSDFANPTRVRNFVEDAEWSTSEAQYDHKAFRYLSTSKLLILPLYIPSYASPKDFFDGFVVYDVDETKDQFSKKFNITHVAGSQSSSDYFCWSTAKLSSRSLVFNGDAMTLKGHTILRHDLDTEEAVGYLNLDAERDSREDPCNNWYYDTPVIMN